MHTYTAAGVHVSKIAPKFSDTFYNLINKFKKYVPN